MRRGRPPYLGLLTPREQEVLSLIREGLTNEQIAERLGISESGARYHVSEILSKLGVPNRQEARLWPEHRPEERRGTYLPSFFGLRFVGVCIVAAAVIGLGVLATGVILMQTRHLVDSPAAAIPGPDPEMEAFLALVAQAQAEAFSRDPRMTLYAVAFVDGSGLYTFRFAQPYGPREVSIVGPYDADPTFPRWQTFEDERPANSPVPDPLDVTRLRNLPVAFTAAASAQAPFPVDALVVVIWSEEGEVRWIAVDASRTPWFQCEGVDADDILSRIACVQS